MFTGIVEEIGVISGLKRNADGILVVIEANKVAKDLKVNDSICCSGICLTAVEIQRNKFKVQLVEETLNRTTSKFWDVGTKLNLERSLLPTSRMGGHFVQGHVDDIIKISSIKVEKDSAIWEFKMTSRIKSYIVEKGSVCLDGISLTIAKKKRNYFTIALIPHTLSVTTWKKKIVNDLVNVEVDILAKYVEISLGKKP